MEEPIRFRGPGSSVSLVKLLLKVLESLFMVSAVNHQGLPYVVDVVQRLEFGYAAGEHHREECYEAVGMFPQAQVCFSTELHKSKKIC